MTTQGAAAAYRAAIADGYKYATSVYCHPRAKKRLSKLLELAERREAEYPYLARETWFYQEDSIQGPTDYHGLYRTVRV